MCIRDSASPVDAVPTREFYKVYVRRIDRDAYRDQNTRYFLITRYCYHYSYGEEAILDYERYSYSNRLIWDDGTDCALGGVYSSNANVTRVEQDLYEDSRGGYYRTRYCYEYAYSEDVLVLQDRIIFQRGACDLDF